MTKQLQDFDTPLDLGVIYASIDNEGFSEQTLQLIDNYINDILNGKTDLIQFNQQEHAGLCCAGEVLIGAYIVCDYARKSLEAGSNVGTGKTSPPNWEIDELQEKLVQQWAEAKNLWSDTAEQDIASEYGSMIAKGAEAKVYYKDGDTSVIKIRTSIYATLGRAFESIVLHNSLFPETPMYVIGFTRDEDGLFRTILTQPYIGCKRLATKQEIDDMVAKKGFRDNYNGQGVNYIGDRLHLEDMHPANVFVDVISEKPLAELSHGTTLDKVKSLYFELNTLYKKLMQCCWSAFARDPRIDSEPGLFVVNQMQTVGEFIHALQAK